MSAWDERFKSHPVWGVIGQLEQITLTIRSFVESDINLLDQLERVSYFTTVVHNRLKSADPLLVSPAHMASTQNVLQSIYNEFNAYQSNRNPGHITNANTHVDNSLSILSGFNKPKEKQDFTDMMKSAESYRKSVSQLTRNVQEEVNRLSSSITSLHNRLTELSQESSNQKIRIDTTISQFQQQFLSAQESRQRDFTDIISKARETHSEQETLLNEQFKSLLAVSGTEFIDTLTSFRNDVKTFNEETSKKTNDLMSDITRSKEHAEKLVGIITATGMVHGYQSTANEERDSALTWRKVAVSSLLFWISVGLTMFYFTYDKELSWASVARQFIISTPFLLLAGFSALQASQHQRTERANRRTELAIASIEPFLATLAEEERNEVKRSLVDQLFGQHEAETHRAESKKILSLISELAKTIQQVQGAVKR